MNTAQYAELFLTEGREHLSAINHSLLALERAGSGATADDAVGAIFRAVHTIKGMSATMGYAAVAELSHELETLLDRIRRGEVAVSQPVTDALFKAADALERGIEESVAGRAVGVDARDALPRLRQFASAAVVETERAPIASAEWTVAAPEGKGRPVRESGDVVAVQVGEDLQPVSAASRPRVEERTPAAEGRRPEHRHVRVELSRLDALMNLIGELVIARGRLEELSRRIGDDALTETVTQAARLIGDLRDEVMTSRMAPVWQVFDRFPRLVRDASRALGKRIDFTVEGKEIELDRSMLDAMGEPIVHLLRNAIDHGIETPEQRIAAGKPEAGRLLLSAARDRSAVVIRVSDDGKGIDRERVLAKAKESGLVDASRAELSDDELMRIVARPGFSTADQVTGMSGRGVGVDAVYTRVRLLGGSVDVRSVTGRGTTVTLRLPLTLAIVRAILARVENEQYAIPTTHVRETVALHPETVTMLRGREVLLHREDVLPIIRLRTVVGLPKANLRELEQAVIIELADKRAALVVDDLVGQQDIVVKQVDQVRDGLRCFSGATILSDGAPALILDVGSLS